MIKYVELTAPEATAYRQAKIISIECDEGDQIAVGDTLFIVQSGKTQLELPSTKSGRVVELIVTEQENITLSTPLLLLETEIKEPTATRSVSDETNSTPISEAASNSTKQQTTSRSKKRDKSSKRLEQQSLNLQAGLDDTDNPSDDALQHVAQTSKDPEIKPMSKIELTTITVPDIGTDSAKVIEILVKVGDKIDKEDAVVTLESDKASMDVPSSHSGTVKSISVDVDQDVSEGAALIELDTSDTESATETQNDQDGSSQSIESDKPNESDNTELEELTVTIPDIGGDSAKVVEILISVGDRVDVEEPLVTLESDKASMDVPSSAAGTIKSIEIGVGDDVSEGTVVVILEHSADSSASAPESSVEEQTKSTDRQTESKTDTQALTKPQPQTDISKETQAKNKQPQPSGEGSHASPSIRRFARELGADLSNIKGSGRKDRITKEDVKAYIKGVMTTGQTSPSHQSAEKGAAIPEIPAQDFSKYGEIEVSPLNKIKRLTASNLHRSWLNVPHVTHHDESNINDLESFRKQINAEYKARKQDIKLSPLAFIVKAVVNALQTYPQFNSSLEPGGENLILKKYFHIGIAVDTPNGLVVPVIRDADKKSVAEIAVEMGELAAKARDKKLTMSDMSGACFTISSLGGIGGTSFTPIVNAPEVAILGVSRSKMQPVWNGNEFTPGMMLPLSLSYDHRVIDGAEAARFTRHIAAILEDVRRLTI